MSFAVENSFDAPMLAAAQAVADDNHATMKVFDANNSPQTQYSQLQDVINSGQYNGIIVPPIFGTGLVSLVKQAIAKGIKVVNMDQILGPNLSTDGPQVPGLSANVTFVPTDIGTKLEWRGRRARRRDRLLPRAQRAGLERRDRAHVHRAGRIVVGGTSILGGDGAIWRTVVGVLFIALIGNGSDLLGLNPLYDQIALGVILLIAVGTDAWSRLRAT
jgi:hypothetical protein